MFETFKTEFPIRRTREFSAFKKSLKVSRIILFYCSLCTKICLLDAHMQIFTYRQALRYFKQHTVVKSCIIYAKCMIYFACYFMKKIFIKNGIVQDLRINNLSSTETYSSIFLNYIPLCYNINTCIYLTPLLRKIYINLSPIRYLFFSILS